MNATQATARDDFDLAQALDVDPAAYEERLKAANASGYRYSLSATQAARLETLLGPKVARRLTHKGDLLAARVYYHRQATLSELAPSRGAVPYPHDPWESVEQADLALWLTLHPGDLAWAHIPNERHGARIGRVLKLQGVQSGVPDVIIWTPTRHGHKGCAIELKRRTARPAQVQSTQTAWLEQLRACGWVAEWCRGAGQAVALVEALYGRGWLP